MKKVLLFTLLILLSGIMFAGGNREVDSSQKVFGYTYWAASDFFATIGDSIKTVAEKNCDHCIIIDFVL